MHLQNFKYDFLSKENSDVYVKSKPVYDLHNLIKLYESEQIKYKNILDKNKYNKKKYHIPIIKKKYPYIV